jgi:hypothetical protein
MTPKGDGGLMPTYCSYCHREYHSDPPGQWETLLHLNDCMPLPSSDKAGLFHEAMGVAIKARQSSDQQAQRIVVLEAALGIIQAMPCTQGEGGCAACVAAAALGDGEA